MDPVNRVTKLLGVLPLLGVGYAAVVVGIVAGRLGIRELAFWALHLADKKLKTAREILEQFYISKENLKK